MRFMMYETKKTALLVLSTLALCVAACQAGDDLEFRSSYTTNVTLSGGDGGPSCEPDQKFDVKERRSLFETHQIALAPFTMSAALHAVASNSGLASQPAVTHDQMMDIYNPGPGLGLGQHCDDGIAFDGTDGLNGYPLQCGRAEGGQIGNLDDWFPIAAVNRFDLAPTDGSHCGEARLVMANNAQGRMFVIFEAQIPNPDPSCGIDACAPVQEMWASLTDIDDPDERADQLRMAFLDGHPDLEAAGFGPFLSQHNLTFGTGQIRTNNFDQGPWTLREFKAIGIKEAVEDPDAKLPSSGALRIVEVPVAANPFGHLWDDSFALPEGDACRDALVDTVEHLMTDDPNLMAVDVPLECLAAESPDSSVQQYHQRLAAGGSGIGSLAQQIQDRILQIDPSSTLTPANIARRAAFAGGCIGCHQQTNGADLGNSVTAPSSAFFVHTDEQSLGACGDGSSLCFGISSALDETFLPHRKSVMDTFLNSGPCCAEIGVEQPFEPAHPSLPVEPIEVESLDVEELMEVEAEVKASGSQVTVGGAPRIRPH